MVSLIRRRRNERYLNGSSSSTSPRQRSPLDVLVPLFALLIGILTGYDHHNNHNHHYQSSPSSSTTTTTTTSSIRFPSSSEQQSSLPSHHPLTSLEILGELSRQQTALHQTLRSEYLSYTGTLFDRLFIDTELFRIDEDSRRRLVRKLLRKVVYASSLSDSSSSSWSVPKETLTFTWVVMGDAGARGFGGWVEQEPQEGGRQVLLSSYAEVLRDTLQRPFAALGIEFVVHNLSIDDVDDGGSSSGSTLLERTLCLDSILDGSTPIDVVSYDVSSSSSSSSSAYQSPTTPSSGSNQGNNSSGDSNTVWSIDLWMNRMATRSDRPVLLWIRADTTILSYRRFRKLDAVGVGVAVMDGRLYERWVRGVVPDETKVVKMKSGTNGDVDDDDVGAIGKHGQVPLALRYFLCNGVVEGGRTPSCQRSSGGDVNDGVRIHCVEGGSQSVCRRYKWDVEGHCGGYGRDDVPGWKEHLLLGRLIGSFFFRSLVSAVLDLNTLLTSEEMIGTNGDVTPITGEVADALMNLFDQDDQRDNFLFRTARFDIPDDEERWGGSVLRGVGGVGAGVSASGGEQGSENERDVVGKMLFRGFVSVCRTAGSPKKASVMTNLKEKMERRPSGTTCRETVREYSTPPLFSLRYEDGEFRTRIPNKTEEESVEEQHLTTSVMRVSEQDDAVSVPHLLILCRRMRGEDKHVVIPSQTSGTDFEGIEIVVDGTIAIESIGTENCRFLKRGEDGSFLWNIRGGRGFFSIAFQLKDPNGLVEVTSIILI